MKSTITRDFVMVNGVIAIGYKEYPDWYGIEGIGFIWHGSWADPELEYKGKIINSFAIEDTLWYEYTHDDEDNYIEDSPEDEFGQWVKENEEYVYSLLDEYIENMEVA